jgi:hypothetical protein
MSNHVKLKTRRRWTARLREGAKLLGLNWQMSNLQRLYRQVAAKHGLRLAHHSGQLLNAAKEELITFLDTKTVADSELLIPRKPELNLEQRLAAKRRRLVYAQLGLGDRSATCMFVG